MKKIMALLLGLVLVFGVVGCGNSGGSASADSPEGVLKAYYQALQDKKYEEAYGYLKTTKTKDEYVQEKKSNTMNFKEFTVQDVKATGDTATGTVVFKTGNAQMPEIPLEAQMVKENGKWLVSQVGMGGSEGGAGGAPAGMGGTAPAGMGGSGAAPSGMGGSVAPGTPNPHGAGGSIPLDGSGNPSGSTGSTGTATTPTTPTTPSK